jgi:glycosyltransferase involved in cell wall biosynthesis
MTVLSVVIPTRDRASLLAGALESVDRISRARLGVEKIVVDDGSSDKTREVALEHGSRFLRSPGRGASAARNAGMMAATGDFLLFLDDDDEAIPDGIASLVEALESNADADAAFGRVQLADERLRPFDDPYPEDVRDAFRHLLGSWQQIGSVVVRTAVRDTVGPFDDALVGSQDWDWLLRLALRHRAAFVPRPCVLFRQRPEGGDDALRYRRLAFIRRVFWRNVRRAGRRRPPARDLLRMYARHNGNFAGHFLVSAEAHARQGDLEGARFAVRGALASSPLHVAVGVARRPRLLRMAARSYAPGP